MDTNPISKEVITTSEEAKEILSSMGKEDYHLPVI
jgi:hypothetical protein